jgi:hypothetical protein
MSQGHINADINVTYTDNFLILTELDEFINIDAFTYAVQL